MLDGDAVPCTVPRVVERPAVFAKHYERWCDTLHVLGHLARHASYFHGEVVDTCGLFLWMRPMLLLGGALSLRYECRKQVYTHIGRIGLDAPLNVYRKRWQTGGGGDGGGVSTLHQLDSSDLFFSVAQELPAYVAHVAFIVGVSYLLERKDKNEFKKHLADVNTIVRGAQESERRAHRRRWTVAPR